MVDEKVQKYCDLLLQAQNDLANNLVSKGVEASTDDSLNKLASKVLDINGVTSNYTELQNKPSINGVELNGNKTTQELNITFEISDEQIQKSVNTYLEEHPVLAGATQEQVEQIETNTENINNIANDVYAVAIVPPINDEPVADITQWQVGILTSDTTIGANNNALSVVSVDLKAGEVVGFSDYDTYEFAARHNGAIITPSPYSRTDLVIPEDGEYSFQIMRQVRTGMAAYADEVANTFVVKKSIPATLRHDDTKANIEDLEKLQDSMQSVIVPATQNTPVADNLTWVLGGLGDTTTVNKKAVKLVGIPLKKGDVIGFNNYDTYEFLIEGDGSYKRKDFVVATDGTYNIQVVRIVRTDMTSYINEVAEQFVYKNAKEAHAKSDSILYGGKYCSEGDSITYFNGMPTSSGAVNDNYEGFKNTTDLQIKGFQSYVCNKFNMTLDNFGVSGATVVSELSNMLNRDYSQYDLITIAYGVNDARTGVDLGELGGCADVEFDVTTYTGAYRTLLNKIYADNPTARIILMTPIQRHPINNFGINTENNKGYKLVDYRDRIVEIAKIYGCKICDCYYESGINQYNLYSKSCDGVHPNNKGYEQMGGLLVSVASKF